MTTPEAEATMAESLPQTVEIDRAVLRRLALRRHVRPSYEGTEIPNGGSCLICKTEWGNGCVETHRATCPLAALSRPAPAAEVTAERRSQDNDDENAEWGIRPSNVREAMQVIINQAGFYKPDVPHFEFVQVPLGILRAAAHCFKIALSTPSPDAGRVPEGRCEICDWPLADSADKGCVPGNCSYRPQEGSEEHRRIQSRRASPAVIEARRVLETKAPEQSKCEPNDAARVGLTAALAIQPEAEGWQPIETAPKDGTPVDLWIVGKPSSIEFLTTISSATPDRKSLQGRLADWRWLNDDWRIRAGLQPLSGLRMYDCIATHWRPLPAPPPAEGG